MSKEQIIDFVITWVDGADEKWLREKQKYQSNLGMDNTIARYRDFGTLKYVLRSIEKFAPWVRNIFLVTNGQVPKWLILDNPKLKLVKHSDFIPQEYLPTFNSNTIEWYLHKIEGLAENFVYFNDDVILTDYVQPDDFFKNDLPCDSFGLGVVKPRGTYSKIAFISFNNMSVINDHFSFKNTIKTHRKKFFNLKYGSRLIKTYILSKLNGFYGMYDPHITLAFKKTYFELLWEKEKELIEETCKNKFRSKNDVSIWLVRYWQILTGNFIPRSTKFGEFYSMHKFVQDKTIKKKLKNRKYKVLCINDNNQGNLEFEYERNLFIDIMEVILNEKGHLEK